MTNTVFDNVYSRWINFVLAAGIGLGLLFSLVTKSKYCCLFVSLYINHAPDLHRIFPCANIILIHNIIVRAFYRKIYSATCHVRCWGRTGERLYKLSAWFSKPQSISRVSWKGNIVYLVWHLWKTVSCYSVKALYLSLTFTNAVYGAKVVNCFYTGWR